MEHEEYFVEIADYPNYSVSNLGRIVNTKFDRDLKPFCNENGKLKVILYRDNVRETFYVHRLVAEAFFIDFAWLETDVKHISNDYNDNSVGNLHLVSSHFKKG